jgi:hypothetical protein
MHAHQSAPTSCASYRDLIANVTNWATTNHKKLFLSELGTNAISGRGTRRLDGELSALIPAIRCICATTASRWLARSFCHPTLFISLPRLFFGKPLDPHAT